MSNEFHVTSHKDKKTLKESLVTRYSLLVTRFLLAFQFLTIMPLRVKGDVSEKAVSGSAAFFPVVGTCQGILAIFSAALLLKLFSPDVTAGLITLILIISNGGFHLDGLADTFDALAVKSTGDAIKDREKRLTVMKDSTTGVIGVVAIVIAILLKFLLIHSLLTLDYRLLLLMPVFSKWAVNSAIFHGRAARPDGLGRIFLKNKSAGEFSFSAIFTLGFLLFVYSILGYPLSFLLFMPLIYIMALFAAKFFDKKFGGLTGDTFGAISEIAEILFLMVISIWLQRFT